LVWAIEKASVIAPRPFLLFSVSILAGWWKLIRQSGGKNKSFYMCRLPDFWIGLGLDMDFWLRKRQKQYSGRFGYAFTPAFGRAVCRFRGGFLEAQG
jgi:hypothetical protein